MNSGLGDFIISSICPAGILEFGSGTGNLASYIVRGLPHVYGCCIEPLNPAPPKLRSTPSWLNVDIFDKNESRVPLGPFDLVLSIEVAEHIERHQHRFFRLRCGKSENLGRFLGRKTTSESTWSRIRTAGERME